MDIEEILNSINQDKLSLQELLNYIDNPSILVKANVIMAIVRNGYDNKIVIEKLTEIATSSENRTPVLGNISNSKLSIAALKWLGTSKSLEKYEMIISQLDDDLRRDIERLIVDKPIF